VPAGHHRNGCVVTAGETTGSIDFSLALWIDLGHVTDAGSGSPLSNVTVYFYDASGTAEGSATTDASGNYSKNLLPRNSLRRHVELLGLHRRTVRQPAVLRMRVTSGTSIAVAGGATTSGVNFGLMKAVSLAAMTVSPDILDFGPCGWFKPVDGH